MDTDVALARRLARDLEGAFPALVEAHQDRLYTIALRLLGERRDAEEVAQDALVRAFRAMAGYPRDRIATLRLRPWLASIAVNLARNRRRRLDERQPPGQLEPMLDAGFDVPLDGRSRPDATAGRRETQRELATALLRLPPAVRAAIVLRHVDGLSVAETAEVLGRPEGTVKAQVHRGLRELREHLEREPATAITNAHVTATAPRAAARLMPALEAIR
ncbi:MAG TPA: sigma-70 family RNA polymerase sigma factor [Candidatus Binatia bacterium]|nr:sigma-70 family RNA polymerase sigma factor [Candidatus Binatia bacterium]